MSNIENNKNQKLVEEKQWLAAYWMARGLPLGDVVEWGFSSKDSSNDEAPPCQPSQLNV